MKILFVVGPTASGKSALALEVAEKLGGEIICADSRTIYKGLDIATAKPTPEEQAKVPHWGLDLVTPDKTYSAADFKAYASERIKDIQNRGKLPIITGGTGLYVDGLLFDFDFGPAADPEARVRLESLSLEELQAEIKARGVEMPENSRNKRYLIRALEQGGVNRRKQAIRPDALVIGLDPGKDVLDERIRTRARQMLETGALQEAEQLFKDYGKGVPAARAPFFKAFAPYYTEGAPLEACLERFILNDRQLSKRQRTWFKRNQAINWFESAEKALPFCYNSLER
jgi:tRNA dimethylallyltransferase